MKTKSVYKIIFIQLGEIYEVFAKANMTGDAVDMAAKFLSDFNILGESLGFK